MPHGLPVRILVADHDAFSRAVLTDSLIEWGHDVVEVTDGAEALKLLSEKGAPQVAILDWLMPELDGIQLCREIRVQHLEPYRYILILTSKSEQADLFTALHAGADDYLTKPFSPVELHARLYRAQRTLELLAELRAARDALKYQAMRDPLTGLFNRGRIVRILETELVRMRRGESSLSILLADLDHFKRVNDGHGHLAGDAALREAASRLNRSSRVYDSIGRYGGEEFLVVLPDCDEEQATSVAERHRARIAGSSISVRGTKLRMSVSIGVATASESGLPSASLLIQAADDALYQAKANGRNRVERSAGTRVLVRVMQ